MKWGPVLIGYVIGSLFSVFQLWAWIKTLTSGGGKQVANA